VPYADPAKRRELNRQWMVAWRATKPERARASLQKWRIQNPDYRRNRYHTDENTRIRDLLRSRIYQALKRRLPGNWQSSRRKSDVSLGLEIATGCSKPELIAHIEAQFLPGMSWGNYGRGGWELDHITPCASFDLTDEDQLLRCFHYTNLRPLWRIDNQRRPRKE
jgi:hypothetical protein